MRRSALDTELHSCSWFLHKSWSKVSLSCMGELLRVTESASTSHLDHCLCLSFQLQKVIAIPVNPAIFSVSLTGKKHRKIQASPSRKHSRKAAVSVQSLYKVTSLLCRPYFLSLFFFFFFNLSSQSSHHPPLKPPFSSPFPSSYLSPTPYA